MTNKTQKYWMYALIGVVVLLGIFFITQNVAMTNECGGIFNKECGEDYHCELDDYQFPQSKWMVGRCWGLGGIRECGGIMGINCPEGFECVFPQDAPKDSFGECKPVGDITFWIIKEGKCISVSPNQVGSEKKFTTRKACESYLEDPNQPQEDCWMLTWAETAGAEPECLKQTCPKSCAIMTECFFNEDNCKDAVVNIKNRQYCRDYLSSIGGDENCYHIFLYHPVCGDDSVNYPNEAEACCYGKERRVIWYTEGECQKNK